MVTYGFQKGEKYKDEFNEFLNYFRSQVGTRKYDYGYDDESSTFDLEGKNGTINVIF